MSVEAATFGAHYNQVSSTFEPTTPAKLVRVILDASYVRRADFIFTGTVNQNPSEQATRYAGDLVQIGGQLRVRPQRWLVLNASFAGGFDRFANGQSVGGDPPIDQVFNTATIPGFDEGTQFVRTGVGAWVDARDRDLSPSVGVLFGGNADFYFTIGNDKSRYARARGLVEVPIPLWHHSHVLVLRASMLTVVPIHGVVPFIEMATLGGPTDLRGFQIDQFRDFSSLLFTAEYRWPIWMWMDATLFADWGGVFARDFSDFNVHQMNPDVGFGVRLHTSRRYFFRKQFAYGFDSGWQIYLSGNSQ
jgi:hypothetical protein